MSSLRVFLVDNSQLASQRDGVKFWRNFQETYQGPGISFGATVTGIVLGDWLHVGDFFLPFYARGKLILREIPDASVYLVDNSLLQSMKIGMNFRRSPARSPDARFRSLLAPYGTLVGGVPHDDHWLQLGDYFLPFEVSDHQVLQPCKEDIALYAVSESAHFVTSPNCLCVVEPEKTPPCYWGRYV